MKQNELSKWLKGLVITTGIIGLLVYLFLVPEIGKDIIYSNPELNYMFYPSLIFIWISAIPFYIALVKCWEICCEISKDNSFSENNARSLIFISKLSLLEGLLFLIGIIILFLLKVIHIQVFFMLLLLIFIAIAITVVAASLSHLVKKASDLKQENEYTI